LIWAVAPYKKKNYVFLLCMLWASANLCILLILFKTYPLGSTANVVVGLLCYFSSGMNMSSYWMCKGRE
jgi:hypothetical protein